MNSFRMARVLRRAQTEEEKELWRCLRAGRFAGFKFRRQHPLFGYILDLYCPVAKLSIELDGFHHGMPVQSQQDRIRADFLRTRGILELRFWNHQWNKNRDGVLLEIWRELERRTGKAKLARKSENQRYVPPDPEKLT